MANGGKFVFEADSIKIRKWDAVKLFVNTGNTDCSGFFAGLDIFE